MKVDITTTNDTLEDLMEELDYLDDKMTLLVLSQSLYLLNRDRTLLFADCNEYRESFAKKLRFDKLLQLSLGK